MTDKKYCIRPGYVKREVAGEHLAIPIDSASSAHIVVLNPVSSFIWEQLQTEKSFEELLDALLQKYTVEKEEATEHLKEFIDELQKNNLLK